MKLFVSSILLLLIVPTISLTDISSNNISYNNISSQYNNEIQILFNLLNEIDLNNTNIYLNTLTNFIELISLNNYTNDYQEYMILTILDIISNISTNEYTCNEILKIIYTIRSNTIYFNYGNKYVLECINRYIEYSNNYRYCSVNISSLSTYLYIANSYYYISKLIAHNNYSNIFNDETYSNIELCIRKNINFNPKTETYYVIRSEREILLTGKVIEFMINSFNAKYDSILIYNVNTKYLINSVFESINNIIFNNERELFKIMFSNIEYIYLGLYNNSIIKVFENTLRLSNACNDANHNINNSDIRCLMYWSYIELYKTKAELIIPKKQNNAVEIEIVSDYNNYLINMILVSVSSKSLIEQELEHMYIILYIFEMKDNNLVALAENTLSSMVHFGEKLFFDIKFDVINDIFYSIYENILVYAFLINDTNHEKIITNQWDYFYISKSIGTSKKVLLNQCYKKDDKDKRSIKNIEISSNIVRPGDVIWIKWEITGNIQNVVVILKSDDVIPFEGVYLREVPIYTIMNEKKYNPVVKSHNGYNNVSFTIPHIPEIRNGTIEIRDVNKFDNNTMISAQESINILACETYCVNGKCLAKENFCKCRKNFKGIDCSVSGCDNNLCNFHGNITKNCNCDCNTNWVGQYCEKCKLDRSGCQKNLWDSNCSVCYAKEYRTLSTWMLFGMKNLKILSDEILIDTLLQDIALMNNEEYLEVVFSIEKIIHSKQFSIFKFNAVLLNDKLNKSNVEWDDLMQKKAKNKNNLMLLQRGIKYIPTENNNDDKEGLVATLTMVIITMVVVLLLGLTIIIKRMHQKQKIKKGLREKSSFKEPEGQNDIKLPINLSSLQDLFDNKEIELKPHQWDKRSPRAKALSISSCHSNSPLYSKSVAMFQNPEELEEGSSNIKIEERLKTRRSSFIVNTNNTCRISRALSL